MTRVALPSTGKKTGCYGLEFPDGYKADTRPGGSVEVDDYHAAQINSSTNGRLGLISSTLAMSIGTKASRSCAPCRRVWQAWSLHCPKCGQQTDPS